MCFDLFNFDDCGKRKCCCEKCEGRFNEKNFDCCNEKRRHDCAVKCHNCFANFCFFDCPFHKRFKSEFEKMNFIDDKCCCGRKENFGHDRCCKDDFDCDRC